MRNTVSDLHDVLAVVHASASSMHDTEMRRMHVLDFHLEHVHEVQDQSGAAK